ncbi:unnamed protein product, partial [Mesorhabditis belari]|uniref:Protein kinase domain-containing protein n=1 Tax=Mesorhabditis belari TaxID=2138241 RepID=A0AAF3J4D5_9BILA
MNADFQADFQRTVYASICDKNRLGAGGNGTVYRLRNALPSSVIKLYHSKNIFRAMEKEAQALAALRHGNIVQFYGLIKEQMNGREPIFGIRMELCERGSLDKWVLDGTTTYSIRTVIHWAVHLFKALDYLHEQKMIHLDIKTENVLVDTHFTLKLGDLGMVQSESEAAYGGGTPRFMSPKIAIFQPTSKSDIWGVGLILWEIIERREVPLKCAPEDFEKLLARTLEELKCPEDLHDVIAKCLKYNPNERTIDASTALQRCDLMDQIFATYPLMPNPNGPDKLIRPIGFNFPETVPEEVLVGTLIVKENSSWNLSAPDAHMNIESIQPNVKTQHVEPPRLKTLDDYPILKKIIDDEVYASQIDKRLKTFFENLGEQEIEHFAEIAQKTIVQENQVGEQFFLNHEKITSIRNYFGSKAPEIPNNIGNREVYVEAIAKKMVATYTMELQLIYFDVIKLISYCKKLNFDLWSLSYYIHNTIAKLQKYKEVFCKRFYCKSLFSVSLKEQWLLIGAVGKKKFLFLKAELDDAKTMDVQERDGIVVVTKEKNNQARVLDQMTCVRNAELDIEMLISALNRMEDRIGMYAIIKVNKLNDEKKASKIEFYSEHHGEDLPVPGYIFQLSVPPRAVCRCNPKCALTKRWPSDNPETSYESNVSETSLDPQLKLRTCTSKQQIQYLRLHSMICISFLSNQKSCKLTFLTTDLISSEISSDFLFFKLKDEKRKNLVLLDYPEDPINSEKIHCMDENFEIVQIYVSRREIANEEYHRFQLDQLSRDLQEAQMYENWAKR